MLSSAELMYAREYWTGDSRDGYLVNGDGYHYYKMSKQGKILEAYEYYENDDGSIIVSPLPEMKNVHWIDDLGFEDMEVLEQISQTEFESVKSFNKSDS